MYLDSLGNPTSIQGAWSLRRLRAEYTGPVVRLRRSTGGEADFWRGSGKVFYNSSTLLTTWLGAGTAFVVTWYDQSGKNNNATQATAANQPELVLAPDWSSEPTLRFDGTDDCLPFNGAGVVGTNYSVFASAARNSNRASTNYILAGSSGVVNSSLVFGYFSNTQFLFSQNTNNLFSTVPAFTARTGIVAAGRFSSTLLRNTYINGALAGTLATGQALTGNPGAAMGRSGTSFYMGDISEIVLLSRYAADAERSRVETAMAAVHLPAYVPRASQSLATLDKLANPDSAGVGAWSLRRLRAAYTGPLVRLRRSTDNVQDDFWRGGGNTFYSATTTLTTWLGAATAFVVTWYDQSGKNNNATNSTAAQQPQLVVSPDWSREPTLRFDGTDDFLPFNGAGMVNTNYSVCASFARNSAKIDNYVLGGVAVGINNNLIVGYRSGTVFTHAQWGNDYDVAVPAFTTRTGTVAAARHSSTLGKNTFLNGGAGGTLNTYTPLASWAAAAVGRTNSGAVTYYFQGDVSEIVLLSRYVSNTERALVETDLMASFTTPTQAATGLPHIALSLRRVVPSYSGPVLRAERASDAAQDDFYAVGQHGTLLLNGAGQTLEQWQDEAVAYVHTWYDQSGNGRHAIGTTRSDGASVKPRLQRRGSEYVVYVESASQTLGGYFTLGSVSWNASTNGGTTVVTRTDFKGVDRDEQIYNFAGAGVQLRRSSSSSELFFVFPGGNMGGPGAVLVAGRLQIFCGRSESTGASTWVDFTKTSSAFASTLVNSAGTATMGLQTASFFTTTYDITDLVAYDAPLTDAQIETVMRSVIPAAYTAAPVIAYSLRSVNSAYTGPAVLLERSTDAAQSPFYAVGASASLLLNTSRQTPEQWLAGGTGYVRLWYDQSGRGQHATGTTSGASPATLPRLERDGNEYKIVLGGTGAVLDIGSTRWTPNVGPGFCAVFRTNLKSVAGNVDETIFSFSSPTVLFGRYSGQTRLDFEFWEGGTIQQHVEPSSNTLRDGLQTVAARLANVGTNSWQLSIFTEYTKSTSATFTQVYASRTATTSRIGVGNDNMDITDALFFNQSLPDAEVEAWCSRVQPPMVLGASGTRVHSTGACALQQLSAASRAACRAAYGLSSLSSTYTGAAVRVRRSSDAAEADFYAVGKWRLLRLLAGGGVQTLEAWLAGTTGSLVTWFDQSGSGNHSVAVTGAVGVTTSNAEGNNPEGLWQLSVGQSVTYIDLLADSGAAAQGVWSLRQVRAAYTGPIVRLRRSTDNVQADFFRVGTGTGFYNGDGTLTTWLGAATAFVVTWYDQSGKNNHATQATAANQPTLVLAPDWLAEPTLRFDGTDDFLTFSGSSMANTDYSVFALFARNSAKTNNFVVGGSGGTVNTNLFLGYSNDTTFNVSQYLNNVTSTVPAFTARVNARVITSARHSSTLFKNVYLNGTLAGSSASSSPLASWTGSAIGRWYSSSYFQGDVSEIALMSRYVSDAERAFLEGVILSPAPYVRVPSNTIAAYDRLTVALTASAGPVANVAHYLVYAAPSTTVDYDLAQAKFSVTRDAPANNITMSVGWDGVVRANSVTTMTRSAVARWAAVSNGASFGIYANGALEGTATRAVALPVWDSGDQVYLGGAPNQSRNVIADVRSAYFFDAVLNASDVALLK
jgi:hypothetical protein